MGFSQDAMSLEQFFRELQKHVDLPESLNCMKDYQIFTEMDLSGEATSPFCLMSKTLLLMTALYKNCENQPSICYSNIIQRVFQDRLVQYQCEGSDISFQEEIQVKGETSCALGNQKIVHKGI